MAKSPTEKPPRNRDQELPRRQGDSVDSTVGTEKGKEKGKERDRNAPLTEEETYEREPRNQRARSWRDVKD
jgi:hypothetical protein